MDWTFYESENQQNLLKGNTLTGASLKVSLNFPSKSAGIYLFKINSGNTKINPLKWRHSGVFIVNSEQISHVVLVFPFYKFEQVNAGWER